MHPNEIIKQKRRFEMFDANSKAKVLELNSFFGKYTMHFDDRIKKTFIYYDTPDYDLMKSHIVLFKTQIGNFCELNMATEKMSSTARYTLRKNDKKFRIPIKPHDNLLKHKDFLIESFKSMFFSSINFDAEFLMRKLQVAYTIRTVSEEYRSANITGLKITYSFDKDIYTNHFKKVEVRNNVLTIYQHSSASTDKDFDDLISKLTRYLGELTATDKTKIMLARMHTEKRAEQIIKEQNERMEAKLKKVKDSKKKK